VRQQPGVDVEGLVEPDLEVLVLYVEAWSARIEEGELPPTEELLRLLEGEVPGGVGAEVQRTTGGRSTRARWGEPQPPVL
jgi:hypothetical protein